MNTINLLTHLTTHELTRLTATPIIPLWLLVVLLAAGLAGALIQYRLIRKRLARGKALTLSLLRLGAFWILILFALNVSLVSTKEHKVAPSIAILLDASWSMALPGKDAGGSRLDEARQILLGGSKPLLTSLAETSEVRLYRLDDAFRELDAGELSGLKPGGKGGDLNAAIRKLTGKASLALLLSDGTSISRRLSV